MTDAGSKPIRKRKIHLFYIWIAFSHTVRTVTSTKLTWNTASCQQLIGATPFRRYVLSSNASCYVPLRENDRVRQFSPSHKLSNTMHTLGGVNFSRTTTAMMMPSSSNQSLLKVQHNGNKKHNFDALSTLELRGGTIKRLASTSNDDNDTLSSSSSSSPPDDDETKKRARQKTDALLAKLTSYFPLYLIIASSVGLYHPPSLTWVTSKPWIVSLMLSFVMMGTGLKLRLSDFTKIFSGSDKMSVPIGLSCQLLITPLVALASSRYFLLRPAKNGVNVLDESRQLLHLGLVLVGCSPAGAISNLMSLLSDANVALSVLLTSVSTLLSTVMTPLRVKSLVGSGAGGRDIRINGLALCIATVKVILLPVLSGMAINAAFPSLTANILARYAPLISVGLGSIICGGVVASNAPIMASSSEAASLLFPMMCAILVFHGISFLLGYFFPKFVCGCNEKISRTISFQTAMPNAILAVVLAQSLSAAAGSSSSSQMLLTALPGAVSATCSICMAGMLSSLWASSKNDINT